MKPNDKAIEATRKAYCEAAVSPMEMALEAAYADQFQSGDYAGLIARLRRKSKRYSAEEDAADALEALLAERDIYKNWLDNYEKQFAAKVEELVTVRLERDALKAEREPNYALDIMRTKMRENNGQGVDIIVCEMSGVRGGENGFPVSLVRVDGRLCVRGINEGGYACVDIDLQDLLIWLNHRTPELEELAIVRAERDALLARLAPVDDEKLVEIAVKSIEDAFSNLQAPNSVEPETTSDNVARIVITAIRPHIEAAERERCAKALEITSDEIRLHAGEMTAQEMRSVLAVLAWRAAAIRSGK